jgi:hypothetical protein
MRAHVGHTAGAMWAVRRLSRQVAVHLAVVCVALKELALDERLDPGSTQAVQVQSYMRYTCGAQAMHSERLNPGRVLHRQCRTARAIQQI